MSVPKLAIRPSFENICMLLAARRCYDAGQSIADIAASAGRSRSTIRRWLRTTGLRDGLPNIRTEKLGDGHQVRDSQ